MTVKEINEEIARLEELKENLEKKELEKQKQYIGCYFRHEDGTAGRITHVNDFGCIYRIEFRHGDGYMAAEEEQAFDFDKLEMISSDEFWEEFYQAVSNMKETIENCVYEYQERNQEVEE